MADTSSIGLILQAALLTTWLVSKVNPLAEHAQKQLSRSDIEN
jgi:hypothetical protein